MFDKIERTTRQGFFSRIAQSFMGVLIGFLLVPISIFLISWNEYRTIHRTQGLIQAEKVVAEMASPFEVDPQLDKRLVHVSGTATTEELLTDGVFEIGTKALRLERQVEMYQWTERKESKTRDKLGGGTETITTYDYQRQWHRDRVNSESFEQPSGHTNPQPHYPSTSLVSERATLGTFHLRPSLVLRLNAWKDIVIDESIVLGKLDPSDRAHFKTESNSLYLSTDTPVIKDPKVGDLRIRFRMVEPMTVSLLSQQMGNEFEPYKTINGETIESIVSGEKSATDMFASLRFENATLAIILRLVGWLLACVGFSLMAGPLKALANFVPLLGKMVGVATMLIGFILGSTVALITISIAWMAVRPVFSLSLLAVAAVGIYFLMRRKKAAEPPMAVLVT